VQQIAIPNVVGQTYQSAQSQLLAANLRVAQTPVNSSQPTNTVVSESPSAGTRVGAGTTVTLSVSKGAAATTPVPDVTNQDEPTAKALLQGSGFRVTVTTQAVTDPGQDGIVLSQSPAGGSSAASGSTVTIVVGKYSGTTTSVP
jgi:serine/threonine-protein kinase